MSAEIIILCLTGIGWLIGQWILKNRELEYKHFDQKVEAYQKYLKSFVEMTIDIRKGNPIKLQEASQALIDFKEAVLIWGKPRMVKDFVNYLRLLNNLKNDDYSQVHIMDFLEKMIRRDLGHHDWFLRKGELAQIFLSEDVEAIFKRGKTKE